MFAKRQVRQTASFCVRQKKNSKCVFSKRQLSQCVRQTATFCVRQVTSLVCVCQLQSDFMCWPNSKFLCWPNSQFLCWPNSKFLCSLNGKSVSVFSAGHNGKCLYVAYSFRQIASFCVRQMGKFLCSQNRKFPCSPNGQVSVFAKSASFCVFSSGRNGKVSM